MPEAVDFPLASVKELIGQAHQAIEQHGGRCLFRVKVGANNTLVGNLDRRNQVISIDAALAATQTSPSSPGYDFAQTLKTRWLEYDYMQRVLIYAEIGSKMHLLSVTKPWLT